MPEADGSDESGPAPSEDPVGLPADQVGRRPQGAVDVVVRPKLWLVVLLAVVPASAVWWTVQEFGRGRFDSRVPLYGLAVGAALIVAATSRLVVAGRTLRRVTLFGGRAVSLDALATVRTERANFLKRQGHGEITVVVVDRFGRAMVFKPRSWSKGARPVLALLDVCVAAQRIPVDEKTAARLAAARAGHGDIPAWAYRGASTSRDAPRTSPGLPEIARSRPLAFVVKATSTPARRLVFTFAVLVGALVVGAGVVGLTVVGNDLAASHFDQERCAPNRHRWTTDADVERSILDPVAEADRVKGSNFYDMEAPNVTTLTADDLLYGDSSDFVTGQHVTWGDPDNPGTSIRIEQFTSHQAALDYNRRWGDWHCRQPETSFVLPLVPGSAAFRYEAGTADEDKVSFVRGDVRVEVITWTRHRR